MPRAALKWTHLVRVRQIIFNKALVFTNTNEGYPPVLPDAEFQPRYRSRVTPVAPDVDPGVSWPIVVALTPRKFDAQVAKGLVSTSTHGHEKGRKTTRQ